MGLEAVAVERRHAHHAGTAGGPGDRTGVVAGPALGGQWLGCRDGALGASGLLANDYGYDVVEASTPAVISVVEKINEPRYPSFKGIMAAKKKPVESWTLADVGVGPDEVGLGAAWTTVSSFAARPPRGGGTVVSVDGTGAGQLVAFLFERTFV